MFRIFSDVSGNEINQGPDGSVGSVIENGNDSEKQTESEE